MIRRARPRGGAAALLVALAAAGCAEMQAGMQAGAPGPEAQREAGAAAGAEAGPEIAAAGPATEAPTTGVLGRPAEELLVEVEAGTGRLAIVPKPPGLAPEPAPGLAPGPAPEPLAELLAGPLAEPPFAPGATGEGTEEAEAPETAPDTAPDTGPDPGPDPGDARAFADARRELGLALERVGDVPGAVSELEASAAAAPWPRGERADGAGGTPFDDLARICRRGEPAGAVARACGAAVASNRFAPAVVAELLAHRGDAVAELGRTRQALADYEAALKIESTQHRALIGRARLRIDAGQTTRALNDLRLAIATGPRPAEARLARARAYQMLGRLERAVADYDAVLADPEARPWHPAAWRGRAGAHCAMGRPEDSAADWQVWADSVPGGPTYLQEMLRARGYLRAPWAPGIGAATLAGLRGWTAAGCP